ncbi:helix-turn-helix domain-containing protein [Nocardioides sp. LHD-245]|uniref:TetR/AcrR family transcriptional regulator n=1 Tax=Nocardioides sp. LHD-245 TaxID=3051387 RepID=UPI0027E147B4|nr:helix-turn-helix domain-containing protein [Nocardioides sp. LHD-245]
MGEARADARRNRDLVLEAAIAALSEDPEAGMVEISARSGLGRSTLYRHFPSREALILAIREKVAAAERAAFREAVAAGGGTPQVLRALAAAIVRVGVEFGAVAVAVPAAPASDDDLRRPRPDEPLLAWLADQAAAGALTASLSPTWMYSMIHGTARAALEDVQVGQCSGAEAGVLLGEVFVRAFGVDGC